MFKKVLKKIQSFANSVKSGVSSNRIQRDCFHEKITKILWNSKEFHENCKKRPPTIRPPKGRPLVPSPFSRKSRGPERTLKLRKIQGHGPEETHVQFHEKPEVQRDAQVTKYSRSRGHEKISHREADAVRPVRAKIWRKNNLHQCSEAWKTAKYPKEVFLLKKKWGRSAKI